MVESPTAAHRLSDGAMLIAMGRTMPRPPVISAMPMKAARPPVMPIGRFFAEAGQGIHQRDARLPTGASLSAPGENRVDIRSFG